MSAISAPGLPVEPASDRARAYLHPIRPCRGTTAISARLPRRNIPTAVLVRATSPSAVGRAARAAHDSHRTRTSLTPARGPSRPTFRPHHPATCLCQPLVPALTHGPDAASELGRLAIDLLPPGHPDDLDELVTRCRRSDRPESHGPALLNDAERDRESKSRSISLTGATHAF